MDFSKIKYINLHAHSDYSLQDGVGAPREHYLETIRKGHCGCAITDHGSYASSFEIYGLSEVCGSDKEIKEELSKVNKKEHPIVAGSELYVYDDRLKNNLRLLVSDSIIRNQSQIRELINKAADNDKYTSLFSKSSEKFISDIMSDSKRKDTNKIGESCLAAIGDLKDFFKNEKRPIKKIKKLRKDLLEFADKTASCGSYKYNHITLLAKNEKGHSNLCRLTSEAHLPENYYMKPRIPLSRLFELKDGLIATSGCFIGMIPQAIHRGTGEEEELTQLFIDNFGDDFYFEVHISDVSWKWNGETRQWDRESYNAQEKVNQRLFELIEKFNKWDNAYITQDSHMPKKEDKEHQDLMILSDSNNKNGWHFHDAYYIMSVEEMWEKSQINFAHMINEERFIKLCENSVKVLEKCKDFKIERNVKMSDFDPSKHSMGIDNEITKKYDDYLFSLVEKFPNDYYLNKVIKEAKNFDKKLLTSLRIIVHNQKINLESDRYRTRFFDAINTIQLNGYTKLLNYFMIIERFSRVVVENREFKVPGRGSAAGSLPCFGWDITDVDPTEYDLLESRFLSKERIGVIYFSFSSSPIDKWLNEKYPSGLGVELLVLQEEINSLKNDLFKLCDAKFKNQLNREIEFLYHNPEIFAYLKNLKESKQYFEKNENNNIFSYLYGITSLPEGKLKEDIGSMPDIDYDSSCRDLLLADLKRELGDEGVILVGTYGSLKVKSAVEAILKTKTSLTVKDIHALTKNFDKVKLSEEDKKEGELYAFNKCVDGNSEIQEFFYKKHPSIRDGEYVEGVELKKQVETVLGTKKNSGIHAGGAVFGLGSLIDQVPCSRDNETGFYVAQLDKDLLEKFGHVKMDMLGVSTAEELRDTIERVKKTTGIDYFEKKNWDIINKGDDPEVMNAIFGKADTLGIFQFNTDGPTDFFRRLKKPPVFNDCPLVTSTYRPGPMGEGVHEKILAIMNGEIEISKVHPVVDEILKDTYGEIIYQEQVMKIVQDIGGISAFDSDNIRRAMGKKKFKVIEPFKEIFIKNAINFHKMPKEDAEILWGKMEKFAEYGFNKSHAVAYGRMSYFCAFFKHYHPIEWIASVMSRNSRKDSEKDKENYKKFYRKYSHLIVLPCVNNSKEDYEVKDGKIYMPIFSISKIGGDKANKIIENQPYASFKDMILKFQKAGILNKTLVESLIYSGACDSFRPDVSMIKENLIKNDFSSDPFYEESLDILNRSLLNEHPEEETIGTKLSLGIALDEEEINKIASSKFFKEGIDKYQFRKILLSKYYAEMDLVEVNKKILDLFEDDQVSDVEFDLLSNEKDADRILGEYFNRFPEAGDRYRELTAPKIKTTKKGTTTSTPKIINIFKKANEGTKDHIKSQETVKKILEEKKGRMILKELESLKITSYDFEDILGDAIKYHKEKSLHQKEVVLISDEMRRVEIKINLIKNAYEEALRIRNSIDNNNYAEEIPKITSILIQLRSSLGEFESKNCVKNIIVPILQGEYSDHFALSATLGAGPVLLKGLNVSKVFKIKSAVDKNTINIINSCKFDKVTEAEINEKLEFELNYYEYMNLICLANVIYNGKSAFDFFKKINVNEKTLTSTLNTIKKFNINNTNVESYRKILKTLGLSNIDLEETDLLCQIPKVVEDLPSFNGVKYLYGVVFRPDKKEKFKKENFRFNKRTLTLNFFLANGNDIVETRVYNFETYNSAMEEKIQNFHPVILKGEIKYNPANDKVNIILAKEDNCVISLMDQIS